MLNQSSTFFRYKAPRGRSLTASLGVVLLALLPVGMHSTRKGLPPVSAVDPGVRGGAAGAGGYISGLTANQALVESNAKGTFTEINIVAGGTSIKHVGLGAPFDSNSCGSCHAQPAIGGSSLAANPLFNVYQEMGGTNVMPFFEKPDGPTLVAHFPYQVNNLSVPDGFVHQVFTITGRTDAGTCNIAQPDFNTAAAENDLIFRNTTPSFGGGLMDIIQDSDILANMNSNQTLKQQLGISGHPNTDPDDGSVMRFGWKAQTRSLMAFSGEAYNVEEGVSNEFTPNKLNETPGCTPPFPLGPPNGQGPHGVPDDRTAYQAPPKVGAMLTGDPERLQIFMRYLDQPKPSASCPGGGNCTNGQTQFNNVGCVLCHTTSFKTPSSSVAALGNIQANLFSDLLVHHMGPCLADNVPQGSAAGDEFRTSPLWGVGQRVFFLSDGRTSDMVTAVEDHSSKVLTGCSNTNNYPDSEANAVIDNFNTLSPSDQQDLIDFLRSL